MMDICDGDESDKTVHIFLGYFFIVNYCLGTGFLGVPFSFLYSGYLAAIPTLIVTAFFTWITSLWLLEIMARAQALESHKKKKDPIFEITTKRKFEISELSEIFVGKWFKYTYLFIVTLYGFFGLWSFSSVAGTAWATNIPYNFGAMEICDNDAFLYQILPSGGCLYSYYFSLFLFALIVVTLSVLNLREQMAVQVTFGVLRYLTVCIIVLYAIVRLFQGGDACLEGESLLPNQTATDDINDDILHNSTSNISYGEIVFKFDPLGWMVSVPVYVYAFMIHSGISTLTHPIRQKQYLHWMLFINFALALACLMSLGLVVPLWFKASVQETITLNWAIYTRSKYSLQLRILSYYLMFFPSLDIISAYPLTVHAIMNNIYIIVTGNDTSKESKCRYDWLLRFFLRLIGAILPILAAYGMANLIYVLTYAGLVGFGVSFLFPTVLQLKSTFVCMNKFCTTDTQDIQLNSLPARGTDESELSDSTLNGRQSYYDADANYVNKERSPLLQETSEDNNERHLYMTPYSNVVLSHPIFVGIMGAVFVCLFIVTCISLFVHPRQLTCS